MSQYKKNWEDAKTKAEKDGLEIIELGWEQHVIVDVKNNWVYRYPRNRNAAAKLEDEVIILDKLEGYDWQIKIPKLLEFDGVRAKYDLIAGEVLGRKAIESLDSTQISEIGAGLGKFLHQLNSLPNSVVSHKAWVQKGTLYEYYSKHIKGASDNNRWKPRALALLRELEAKDNNQSSMPVHGDLHGFNIIIDETNRKLVGVIDFSEIEIGNRHQDFRKLFMTDERLLRPAIDSYSRAGGKELSEDLVKLWAYVNEWSNACRFAGQPKNATYKRALAHLKKWGQL